MNPALEAAVRPAIEAAMQRAQVPGIALVVAHRQAPAEYLFVGTDANNQPLVEQSLFPIASVTKLATALAVLRLADQGTLHLDDSLALYLPEAVAAQGDVTLHRLLCHTAGVPADLSSAAAPYASGLDWPALAEACLAAEPVIAPETKVIYSNVGYGLLAIVVERQTGQPFAAALELVLQPLGIEGYLGAEPPRQPVLLAGARGEYQGTELEPYNSRFWRSLALPWAGMLTTPGGALALLQAFRGIPEGFIQASTRAEATRNQAGDLDCAVFERVPWDPCYWGLGPELRATKSPHWAPPEAGPTSFGHAGQSGCVVWAEPGMNVAWALFGSRTAANGWLLKHGSTIGSAILGAVQAQANA